MSGEESAGNHAGRLAFEEAFVFVGVEEFVKFVGCGEFDFDNPVGIGVFVDESGFVGECFVDFDHGAANGRNEVGSGLYAFDGAEFFAGIDFVVDVGHINVNDVSECVLCIIGDADVTEVAVDAYIFMRFGVEQTLRNV